jgi:hypothetical protein
MYASTRCPNTPSLALGADRNFSMALLNTTSAGALDWNYTINFEVRALYYHSGRNL